MLIDWLSLKMPTDNIDFEQVREWQSTQDRIVRISGDGSVQWETTAWDSVKSDSHQLAFQVTAHAIRIQGSPARIIGDADNVFSCGAAAALDLSGCASRMIAFISQHTGISLPDDVTCWDCSRVDVTENLYLGSLPVVRQALAILRDCEGGRYRVSQQAGDTVYWSHKSRLRSGKAYAKGAEIAQKMTQSSKAKVQQSSKAKVQQSSKAKVQQSSRAYDIEEIALANSLLRLELKLGAQYWRERTACRWHNVKPEQLQQEWHSYFSRMIGGAEIVNQESIYERLLTVVDIDKQGKPKEGQAKAAFGLWCLLQSQGWQKARDMTNKATWYRNLKHLRNAGLSDADISKGNIVQLRRKVLEAVPVTNWAQLRTLHYQQAA